MIEKGIVIIERDCDNLKFSSKINEVLRTILNLFIQKFHNHKKAQNTYNRTKIKNAPKNHLREK